MRRTYRTARQLHAVGGDDRRAAGARSRGRSQRLPRAVRRRRARRALRRDGRRDDCAAGGARHEGRRADGHGLSVHAGDRLLGRRRRGLPGAGAGLRSHQEPRNRPRPFHALRRHAVRGRVLRQAPRADPRRPQRRRNPRRAGRPQPRPPARRLQGRQPRRIRQDRRDRCRDPAQRGHVHDRPGRHAARRAADDRGPAWRCLPRCPAVAGRGGRTGRAEEGAAVRRRHRRHRRGAAEGRQRGRLLEQCAEQGQRDPRGAGVALGLEAVLRPEPQGPRQGLFALGRLPGGNPLRSDPLRHPAEIDEVDRSDAAAGAGRRQPRARRCRLHPRRLRPRDHLGDPRLQRWRRRTGPAVRPARRAAALRREHQRRGLAAPAGVDRGILRRRTAQCRGRPHCQPPRLRRREPDRGCGLCLVAGGDQHGRQRTGIRPQLDGAGRRLRHHPVDLRLHHVRQDPGAVAERQAQDLRRERRRHRDLRGRRDRRAEAPGRRRARWRPHLRGDQVHRRFLGRQGAGAHCAAQRRPGPRAAPRLRQGRLLAGNAGPDRGPRHRHRGRRPRRGADHHPGAGP